MLNPHYCWLAQMFKCGHVLFPCLSTHSELAKNLLVILSQVCYQLIRKARLRLELRLRTRSSTFAHWHKITRYSRRKRLCNNLPLYRKRYKETGIVLDQQYPKVVDLLPCRLLKPFFASWNQHQWSAFAFSKSSCTQMNPIAPFYQLLGRLLLQL